MPAATRKIHRRHAPGVLVVEQSRDLALVKRMLSAAGMFAEGVEAPGSCFLLAYVGSDVGGIIGIEARVDAALLRSLMVVDSMRRRGLGAALIAAARSAAHTRGARTLYAIAPTADAPLPVTRAACADAIPTAPDAARYLERFGFAPAPPANLIAALGGTFLVDYLRERPDDLARHRIMSLDISNDGVILR